MSPLEIVGSLALVALAACAAWVIGTHVPLDGAPDKERMLNIGDDE